MRTLAFKLTIAFLFVGVIGAGLVAIFVGWQTESQFDQYIYDLYHDDLVELSNQLSAHYAEYGNWDGINAVLIRDQSSQYGNGANGGGPPGNGHRGYEWLPVTLVDENRVVVNAGEQYSVGDHLSRRETNKGVPIAVNDETIGWVILDSFDSSGSVPAESPESHFLANVNQATILGALGASLIALVLGVFLARSISRPVGELTNATRVVARGELGHQVPVRTNDELGELASSFNQMSADLAQANQSRRQMTADIAHDLRTPMSVILGYTESLKDGRLVGSQEIYEILHQEAHHLGHLIEDLRLLSLADAGELPLVQRPTPPQALLERVALAHMPQAVEKGIALQVQEKDGLPTVELDPERITQVLGNLVSNAIRHTLEGGTISLAANQVDDNHLRMTVQDSGTGIPAEDLPYIFKRFFRGDRVRQRTGSSGLGLAIARSIVEAHKGTITAESQEGQGTTFIITLPIQSA
ncbi:MAG: HAMP domain-containing sensor histidine kinase [Candidatus Promineifilaceae bacterium]